MASKPHPVPSRRSTELSNQKKARAVIDQMIEALGGQAYLTVQDFYAEGRSGSFHNETLAGYGLYYRFWKWPDQDRIELTKKRDIVQLYLGDRQRTKLPIRVFMPWICKKMKNCSRPYSAGVTTPRDRSAEVVDRAWHSAAG